MAEEGKIPPPPPPPSAPNSQSIPPPPPPPSVKKKEDEKDGSTSSGQPTPLSQTDGQQSASSGEKVDYVTSPAYKPKVFTLEPQRSDQLKTPTQGAPNFTTGGTNVPLAIPASETDSAGNKIPSLPNYEGYVSTPTADKFVSLVKDKKYKLGAKGLGNYGNGQDTLVDEIDCSGAVCTVRNADGKKYDLLNTNAAKFKALAKTTNIKDAETIDGDMILMNTEGKGIDHIGLIVVDDEGRRFIAESSSTYGGTTITPFKERLEDLKKRKGDNFSYEIVSDSDKRGDPKPWVDVDINKPIDYVTNPDYQPKIFKQNEYKVVTTDVGGDKVGVGESRSSDYNEVRKVQAKENELFVNDVKLKAAQISNQYKTALESDLEYKQAIQQTVEKQAQYLAARKASLDAMVAQGIKTQDEADAEYNRFQKLYSETIDAHVAANPEVQRISKKYGEEAQQVFDDYYNRVSKTQEAINANFDREAYASIGPLESFGNSIINEVISTLKVVPETKLVLGELVESPALIEAGAEQTKSLDTMYLPTKEVVKSFKEGDYAGSLAAAGGYTVNFLGSVLRGAATYGTSPYIEMTAPLYLQSIEAKAQETGKTPDEIIYEDLEDEITPISAGVAMGVLEKAGMSGVIKNIKGAEGVAKDVIKSELKTQSKTMYDDLVRITKNTAKTSARESLTEGAQGVIEAGTPESFASGTSLFTEKGGKAFWEGMVQYAQSPEMVETLVGTAIGGAPLGFVGGGKKSLTAIQDFSALTPDQYNDIRTAVGNQAELFQNLDKLVESGKMTEQAAGNVKQKAAQFNEIDGQIPINVATKDRPRVFGMLSRLNAIEAEMDGKNKQLTTPLNEEKKAIEDELTNIVSTESEQIEKKSKEKTTVEQYGDKQEVKTKAPEPKSFASSIGEVEDISDVLEGGQSVQVGDTKVILREEPDKVVIESIETPVEQQGKGAARQAMDKLVQSADEQGKTLELTVAPKTEDTNKERLASFYESLGFEKTEGDKMVRMPAQKAAEINNPKFKEWFGASKAVDEQQIPKVFYHGTKANEDFVEFKGDLIFVSPDAEYADAIAKTEFAKDAEYGENARIIPVYVKTENPFDFEKTEDVDALLEKVRQADAEGRIDHTYNDFGKIKKAREKFSEEDYIRLRDNIEKGNYAAIEQFVPQIKELGFDGLYVNERKPGSPKGAAPVKNLAVFSPEQVKFALKEPLKQSKDDSQDKKRVPSKESQRKEPEQAKSEQEAGEEASGASRILQGEEEVADIEDAVQAVRQTEKGAEFTEIEAETAAAIHLETGEPIEKVVDYVNEQSAKTREAIKKATELFDQITELKKDKKNLSKVRELTKQRRELLDANPDIKLIDDNIKKIYDQLEKQGIIKRSGNCP